MKRRPAVMMAAWGAVERGSRMILPRRRSVAEEKGPLTKCPGCGRPTKGSACRGCEARGV